MSLSVTFKKTNGDLVKVDCTRPIRVNDVPLQDIPTYENGGVGTHITEMDQLKQLLVDCDLGDFKSVNDLVQKMRNLQLDFDKTYHEKLYKMEVYRETVNSTCTIN